MFLILTTTPAHHMGKVVGLLLPLPPLSLLLASLDSSLHNLPHLPSQANFGLNGLSEPINELMVPEVPFLVLTKASEF